MFRSSSSTSTAHAPAVPPRAKTLTSPRVQGRRAECAEAASHLYASAVHAAGSSFRSVAHALDIAPNAVRAWGDAEHPAAVTIRDVLAGPRVVREAVAHALLALDGPSAALTTSALLLAARVGAVTAEVAEDTAPDSQGGTALTEGEKARLLALIARAQRELDAIARACR